MRLGRCEQSRHFWQSPGSGWGLLVSWVLLCFCPLQSVLGQGGAAESVQMRLLARLEPGLRVLTGDLRIEVPPDVWSRTSDGSMPFTFYPHHLNALKDTDELTFSRIFPGGYSPAQLLFSPFDPLSRSERALPWEALPEPLELMPLPENAPPRVQRVILDPAPVAGMPVVLEGPYRLEIPQRFGSFGTFRDQLTLAEGWLPLPGLPSDPLSMTALELTLILPRHLTVLLEGQVLDTDALKSCPPLEVNEKAPMKCVSGRASARTPALMVGRLKRVALEPMPLQYIDNRLNAGEVRQLNRLLARMRPIWLDAGLPEPLELPPLVRAPLRRRLMEVGRSQLLVSDRALRSFPGVNRFHEYALVRGLFASWLQGVLQGLETPDLLPLVADGLACQLLERYRQTRIFGEWRARQLLEPFRFLPPVDAMLYAPRFHFAAELYEEPHRYDPLRESLAMMRRGAPSGEALWRKLVDVYGEETLARARDALFRDVQLQGRQRSFLAQVALESKRFEHEVLETVAGWYRPPPPVDYQLSEVQTVREGEGYRTRFKVKAQTKAEPPPTDVVPIVLRTRSETLKLQWEGQGEKILEVQTKEPIRTLQLDPEQRLLEANAVGTLLRDNNQWPRPARLLVTAALSAFDVNTLRPTGAVTLTLTGAHQRDWLVLTDVYSSTQVLYGGTAGYFRYFGAFRDAQWRSQRVGFQLSAAHRAGLPWFGQSTDAYLDTLSVTLSYRYESRLLLSDGSRGGAGTIAVEAGMARQPEETGPYAVIALRGVKPLAFHPHQVLVARFAGDISFGLPDGEGGVGEGLFGLGGASAVRSIASNARVGNQRWLVSLEHRALILPNLDINLGVGRLRRVQAVAFGDMGSVGYDFFALSSPEWGIGVGTRLYLEMFGLYEGLLGLDVAGNPWNEDPPQVLIRFAQPF